MKKGTIAVIIGMYILSFIGIGASLYVYFENRATKEKILQLDMEVTERFRKDDSVSTVIEVQTTTRTIKLKKDNANDKKIDSIQHRILDSLGFNPAKLPNF